MSLPRVMGRAEGATRSRFLAVYEAFDAGAALAGDAMDLGALRRLLPFAFEGLGRALALGRRARLAALWSELTGPERTLLAIGVGWANEERSVDVPVPEDRRADEVDGRGFQRALFHAYALGHPRRFRHAAQPDFDRGVGRGIYFALGARTELIEPALRRFPAVRREALWSGVGVALAFTGGVDDATRHLLVRRGGAPLRAGVERGSALRAALEDAVVP